jgi:putative transposase
VDITYVPTGEGWLYLAVVMDLYSRTVVGWADERADNAGASDGRVSDGRIPSQTSPPVCCIIRIVAAQYCSRDYQALLAESGMRCSMSRKGSCWDNAPMESFSNSLKSERVFHECHGIRDAARRDPFEYIEGFYNRRRRQSSIGCLHAASAI